MISETPGELTHGGNRDEASALAAQPLIARKSIVEVGPLV
jgi:hypothetical protein